MRIEEVAKKATSGKGLLIIGGGFALLFLISLASQSSSDDEENIKLTGAYVSYPDSVTNADVIISTMQNSLDYQTEELSDLIQGNFDATNGYITDGLDANKKISQITHDDIMQGINDLSSKTDKNTTNILNKISSESSSLKGTINNVQSSVLSQMDKQYNKVTNSMSNMSSNISTTHTNVNIGNADNTKSKLDGFDSTSISYMQEKYDTFKRLGMRTGITDIVTGATYNGMNIWGSGTNKDGSTTLYLDGGDKVTLNIDSLSDLGIKSFSSKTSDFSINTNTDDVIKGVISQSKQQTGSPAKTDTITISSGLDVFAPSVIYE